MLQARKRFVGTLFGLFAFCAALSPVLRGQSAASSAGRSKALLPSARRVVFNRIVGPSTAYPHWDNGYLISRDVETYQAGTSNVRLYDSSGNRAVTASIWFPGAVRVVLYSATATSDGRIIAGGSAEKADGTGASFIAMTDHTGKVTNLIQTEGFAPLNICGAPDGTVWSFGGTGFDERTHLPKPGNMLRHFDFGKGEVASYVDRSLFPRYPRPEVQAPIRCSADGVVVYSFNAHAYIQMKYASETPEAYHTEEPAGLRFFGFAATGAKKIYAYFSKPGICGLYYLEFDETSRTAQWVPVTGAVGARTTPGVVTALWGADGDKLVVGRAEDPLGVDALHWAPVADQ